MKSLTNQDLAIIRAVSQAMPQGIIQKKLLQQINLSRQNLQRYIKKLKAKGHITSQKSAHLVYYFTQGNGSLVGGTKTVAFKPKTVAFKKERGRMQRPHAIQVNLGLFRTSFDRLKDTLESLGITYKSYAKPKRLEFNWKGKEVRATRKWLYTHIDAKPAPFGIPIGPLLDAATEEARPLFNDIVAKLGLHTQSDLRGMLKLEVHYWENGYPGNEIAEESLKDKKRIVYARDPVTGKVSAWADSSLGDLKELETNSARVDKQMKEFIQAVDSGELKPLMDEIRTRTDIAGLLAICAHNTESIKEFHIWLKHHDAQIVETTMLLKKLNRMIL